MRGRSGPIAGRLGVLRRSTVLLLVAGVVFMNLAMVSLWAWRTFASSQGFADTTTDMLKEPAVREVLVEQIVNALEQPGPTSQVDGHRPARGRAGRRSARRHRRLPGRVPRRRPRAPLRPRRGQPQQPDRRTSTTPPSSSGPAWPPPTRRSPTPSPPARSTSPSASPRARRSTRRSASPRWPDGWRRRSPRSSAVCLVWAVRRARDRRRALEIIGLTMVGVGVVHFALLVGRAPAHRQPRRHRPRADRAAGRVLERRPPAQRAGQGAHHGRPRDRHRRRPRRHRPDPRPPRRRHRPARRRLARPGWRALGLRRPHRRRLLRHALAGGEHGDRRSARSPSPPSSPAPSACSTSSARCSWTEPAPERVPGGAAPRRRPASRSGSPPCCVTLLFGGLAFARGAAGTRRRAHLSMAEAGCNGHRRAVRPPPRRGRVRRHPQLDGRRRPTTASSSPASTGGIGAQLASGVRAFLIDLHYGVPVGERRLVRTDLRRRGRGGRSPTPTCRPRSGRPATGPSKMLGVGSDDDAARRLPVPRSLRARRAAGRRHVPPDPRLPAGEPERGDHAGASRTTSSPRTRCAALDDGGLADRGLSVAAGRGAADARGDDRCTTATSSSSPRSSGGAAPWYIPAFEHGPGDALRVPDRRPTSPAILNRGEDDQSAAPGEPLARRRPARSRRSPAEVNAQRRAARSGPAVRRASGGGTRTSSPSTSTPTATCSPSSTSSTASPDPHAAREPSVRETVSARSRWGTA